MQQKIKETRINKIKKPEPEKSNLIELISSEQNLLRTIIQNEGEITEEIAAQLEFVHEALLEKIDSYDFVLKNLDIEAEKFQKRGQFFTEISQKIKKTKEYLKQKLKWALSQRENHQLCGSDVVMKLTARKSRVIVDKEAQEMLGKGFDEFIKTKTTYDWDRDAIYEALEAGKEIPFARLEESWNLRTSANTLLKK